MKTDNVVIVYEGGGYDGCFWEHNAALLYKHELHDIYTSGHAGIPGLQNNIFTQRADIAEALRYARKCNGRAVWLDKQSSIDALTTAIVASFVSAVLRRAQQITDCNTLNVKCSVCGKYGDVRWMELSEAHGCGGIASCCDDFICEDCYSMRTCRHCNEYYRDIEYGFCDACIDKACDSSASVADAVNDLEACIRRGTQQLSAMCALLPHMYDKFTRQHECGVAAIRADIESIVDAALVRM